MTSSRVYAYCPSCSTHKDSVRTSFNEDELSNYCSECGSDLEQLDESEYVERLRDEEISWPVEVTIDVPVKLQGDYSHRICEAAGVDMLPISGQEEYYIDEYVGEVPVTVELAEDGTYNLKEVGTL